MKTLKFTEHGTYLIKETIIFLVFSLLILVIGYTHALIEYRILIFAAGLWTLIGGVWFFFGFKCSIPFKLPVFIWLLVYTLSTITSIDPRRSLSQMLLMSTSLFLFFLAYDLVKRNWPTDLFAKGFIFTGSLITIAGLYNAFDWYQNWLSVNPGVWIPSITYRPATANVLAPILNLTAILAIVYIYRSKGIVKKIFFAVIALAALFMLFLTSSRGGWLGAGAGLGFLMVMIGYLEKDRLRHLFNKIKANKVLFGFLIILMLVMIGFAGYILHKQALHPTHGSIFNSRTAFWQTAIGTFKENLLLGQGPFTYGSAFLSNHSTPPGQIWTHAHSSFMNLLAEMGILGFLALFFLVFSYMKSFLKNYRNNLQENQLLLPTSAFLLSYIIHSFFDSLHMEPALIWSLAILMGAAIAENPQSLSQNNSSVKKRPWWVLLLISFAWFGIWSITPYYQAVELANSNQWQPAYEKFQQAVERDPGKGLAHQQLALSAAVLAQQGQQEMLDIAITALQTTIQHEPSWALNHANLANLYLANDQPDQAILTAQNAFELAPRASLYPLNLGYILEQSGDEDQAKSAYLQALDLNPTWATASFWQVNSLRTNTRDTWLLDHPASPTATISETEKILNENQHVSWAYNQLAKLLLEQNNQEAARQALENAGLAYVNTPSDSIETQWLWAEYYSQTGDYNKAIEMGSQAINRYNSYGVDGPGSFGVLQYAPRVFRMSAMAMEIVPQMPNLPVPEIWMERETLLRKWKN